MLQAELELREAAGAGAREELAAADQRFQTLQARSSEALADFEQARSEARHLRARVDEAETVARRAAGLTAQAGKELLDERAKSEEASRLADVHGERLAKAERQLGDARQELDEAHARSEAQAADATRLESELRAERDAAAEARRELADAQQALSRAGERNVAQAAETARLADELRAQRDAAVETLEAELEAAGENLRAEHDAAAAAEHELAAERARAIAGADRATEEQARADEAERRAAETSAQLADSETRVKMLATSEQALRQEFELLTRTDLGQATRRRGRRSSVSSVAYREALASLEDERAERARIEQEAARLADQLSTAAQITVDPGGDQAGAAAETEAAGGSNSAHASIEADLRHLLAVTQRDLDEARAALNEQQARYAAVASNAASDDPTPPMPVGEIAGAAKPWSAVDEDLLDRIARAQEFAAGY